MLLVYVLRNRVNGKYYVGQTARPLNKRIREHHQSRSLIGNALRKYGQKNFETTLFECISSEHQDFMECDLIQRLDCKSPKGYNITDGGEGLKNPTQELRDHYSRIRKGTPSPRKGVHLSDETKAKISQSKKGKISWNKGLSPSAETREKISKTLTGTKQSEETKKRYNRRGELNSFHGRKHSEESREKMRQAKLGTKISEETKRKMSLSHQHQNRI